MKKLRVGVIYGGKSGEHEVSIASAASIIRHLDRSRYDAVPIHIMKDGQWALAAQAPTAISAADVHKQGPASPLQPADPTSLVTAAGLPIVPHLTVLRREWDRDKASIGKRAADHLRFPMFVKPANLGSSVGISKAKSDDQFVQAMDLALEFDRKIVIEAGVAHAREIECAVLGNDDPQASLPGEIVPSGEFYDYNAKYIDGGSTEIIPAQLAPAQVREIQRLAIEAFQAVECAGMARVDFLLGRDSGEMYLNEVNTIPGFTTISMYPKMWKASGLEYPDLLDRLIALALERHAEKQQLRTSIT